MRYVAVLTRSPSLATTLSFLARDRLDREALDAVTIVVVCENIGMVGITNQFIKHFEIIEKKLGLNQQSSLAP